MQSNGFGSTFNAVLYFLFPLSLFLSASLLFGIQPMVAKVLLPIYGGTPAVWIICLVFFQCMLLVAYGYAWILSMLSPNKSWWAIHLGVCLLSLGIVPLKFSPYFVEDFPQQAIFLQLIVQLGLPLFIITASTPLVQYAFSHSKYAKSQDPYYLYVASNIGSLCALISYPLLIERFSTLSEQFEIWNFAYIFYLVCLFILLLISHYRGSIVSSPILILETNVSEINKINPLQHSKSLNVSYDTSLRDDWYRWLFLSFLPCSAMLGVSSYITSDIGSVPLLLIGPLALYLTSFIITFTKKNIIPYEWLKQNYLFFLIIPIFGFSSLFRHINALALILANISAF